MATIEIVPFCSSSSWYALSTTITWSHFVNCSLLVTSSLLSPFDMTYVLKSEWNFSRARHALVILLYVKEVHSETTRQQTPPAKLSTRIFKPLQRIFSTCRLSLLPTWRPPGRNTLLLDSAAESRLVLTFEDELGLNIILTPSCPCSYPGHAGQS